MNTLEIPARTQKQQEKNRPS